MKKLFFITCCILSVQFSFAQLGRLGDRIQQRAKDRVNQKINQKTDNAVDKSVDEVDNEISGKNKNKSKTKTKSSGDNNSSGSNDVGDDNGKRSSSGSGSIKSYSKYDFVPGEKLIAFDDFSSDNIGDLPDKWNTNGSAEVVKLSKGDDRWVMMKGSQFSFIPEYAQSLPDNCTIEFDMLTTWESGQCCCWLQNYFIQLLAMPNKSDYLMNTTSTNNVYGGSNGISVLLNPDCNKTVAVKGMENGKGGAIDSKSNFSDWSPNEPIHVAIVRQKTRFKIYMNETKIFDLPQGLPAAGKKYFLRFGTYVNKESDIETSKLYVSNIRIASGLPDTRNKLVTEGKFVTTGILFDVNSDKIKPQSYGVLKEIANVLTDNADMKVKITGHTDADGNADKNTDLSKRRAAAVKNMLIKEFGISADRLSTDGKGSAQPVEPNSTAKGKAANRRVEFEKM